MGLVFLGVCLPAASLLKAQPMHALVFLLARVGHAVADTTCAALTAQNSSPERRGRNLALLQSTQSASRIFSPLLASLLYTASLGGRGGAPPGTLPFLACGQQELIIHINFALGLIRIPNPLGFYLECSIIMLIFTHRG